MLTEPQLALSVERRFADALEALNESGRALRKSTAELVVRSAAVDRAKQVSKRAEAA